MRNLSQPLTPLYYADVEKQLKRIFFNILFLPLLKVIEQTAPQNIVLNASDPLRDALRTGRIQYSNGVFSGEFSSGITRALRRLGGEFDHRSKVYRLAPAAVPGWIISEAMGYQAKAQKTHEAALRVLDETQKFLERIISENVVNPEQSITKIESGFKHAADVLKVSPTLSPEAKTELKKEYTKNMSLWIDKFSREEISELRQRVEKNAMEGYRFDRLIASIKNRYSVTENKAVFLARQETSLFLAKFREKRFKDGGVSRYRWSTSQDARVRPAIGLKGKAREDAGNHRALNGKVFFYDEPPIVNPHTGKRANPGQDYNCRCVDVPVLEGLDR